MSATTAARAAAATAQPAERARDAAAFARVGLVGLQFAVLVSLVRLFHIENQSVFQVLALAAGGYVVHALLPRAWRLPFFCGLSLASVAVVFGVIPSLWLVGMGTGLILLCHVPVTFRLRVALVLVAAVLLGTLRAGVLPSSIPDRVWPILGGMFMYRLALYLYSVKHQDVPTGGFNAAAYFFMLPNACFPLFPVVDYKTFVRSGQAGDVDQAHQRGLDWILRGFIHLLLYRLVYHQLTLDASDVANLGDLIQFVLSLYLLYLRVSGQFHLIVGVLQLFGFQLPETHHLYYLASSFNDFWRRINIYWKDFMMKLVYLPSFFHLRRFGDKTALVGATLVVFLGTWLLHSYQWFWLLGKFPITGPDALFWGILGVFVVANVLAESSKVRKPLRPGQGWSALLALKTVGTFLTIAVLWSLWSSDTVAEWLGVWHAATVVRPRDLLLLTVLLGVGLAVGGRPWGAVAFGKPKAPARTLRLDALAGGRRLAMMGGIFLLTLPSVQGAMGPSVGGVVATLTEAKLNSRDQALLHQGYYEQLNNSHFTTEVWNVREEAPAGFEDLRQAGGMESVDGILVEELKPLVHLDYKEVPFSTNRWKMRDRDYELAKPAGTYRIAVLGPSDVMGTGVRDGETFDNVLEARLARLATDSGYPRTEVLNFAVQSYSPLQQLAMLEDRVFQFQPDLVLFTAHETDLLYSGRHLRGVLEKGYPIPYPEIREIISRAGITGTMSNPEARARLRPYERPLFKWVVGEMARQSTAHGAKSAMMLIRLPTLERDSLLPMREASQAAGMPVIDLLNVWPALAEPTFRVAPWDQHPNASGHALLADSLYHALAAEQLLPGRTGTLPATRHQVTP